MEQYFDELRDSIKSRIEEIEMEIIRLNAKKEAYNVAISDIIREKYREIADRQNEATP